MADGVTLLIGPKALASSLAQHPETRDTELVVFDEAQVCEAVEHMVRQRPRVVALPEKFAMSPRGTALTHRIAVDAQLAGTQVLMIDAQGSAMPVAAGAGASPTWLPPDGAGTRRVPRIRMRQGIDVQIDGATASLVDLSTMGAQVVSTTVLKPRQRVRVVLAVEPYLIRAAGTVAWALFEIPKSGLPPHYRAGLEFSTADPEPLLQFCIEQAAEAAAS
ncbi:MAG: hypothetical protein ACM3H9_09910 [Rhodospirillaceae bacterium]|jgi:hypothetical protein